MMQLLRTVFALVLSLVFVAATPARAETLYAYGTASTFEIRFDQGYTGERGAMMVAAANWWADRLVSKVNIVLDVSFASQDDGGDDLLCLEDQALLGLGGTTTLFFDFPGAPAGVLYPQALANAISGRDLDSTTVDARLLFNAKLDDNAGWPDCLGGGDWFYGLGTPPDPNDVSFYHTALHELAHGLGFQSYADFETGELFTVSGYPQGINDAFLLRLRHLYLGELRSLALGDISAAGRAAAARDDGDLVWVGEEVDALAGILSAGTNMGKVQMYAPATFAAGGSVSHFDLRLVPDELMEPLTSPSFDARLAEAALHDLGWRDAGTQTLSPLEGDGSGGAGIMIVLVLLAVRVMRSAPGCQPAHARQE
ncbi:MAG: hypothetical protein KDH99_07215 [Alcanivoracaceae bacterium]|nr:hypothetical protein [Alcanivoracaceae bacterium]